MKLIDLLVSHLGSHGGWPIGAEVCAQDNDCEIVFYSRPGIHRRVNNSVWTIPEGVDSNVVKRRIYLEPADDMQTTVIHRTQYEAALSASNQPEWNGEGLPPVGTKCEWQDKNTKAWLPVIVVYSSEWVTVIREGDKSDAVEIAIENYGDEALRQFRPTLNEAERKREESIAAMRNFATNYNNTTVIHAIEQMYDSIAAGKIPHITLK